jgi:predicted amidohydrolase YtcJ
MTFGVIAGLGSLPVNPTALAAESPITVFLARQIVTMDPGWPRATAVAVRNGKILSVGSLDDLTPWLARSEHTIDRTFVDKILLPGFVEAHGHPIVGGTALSRPLLTYLPVPRTYGPPFSGVKTRAEALAKLREYVERAKSSDDPVLAWGYDVIAMGGQHLDRTILDTVSAVQPILVWDASEHFVYANSAAMSKFGITRDDTRINGVGQGTDGAPNGQFFGVQAVQRILQTALAGLLKPDVAFENVKYLMDLSHRNGITTTSELSFGVVNLGLEETVLDRYFNDPGQPMRCVVVADGSTLKATKGAGAIAYVKSLQERPSDKLIFRGVKFFADDALVSLSMMIENPGYIDGHKGLFATPPDQMVERWFPWWQAGFHLHVHTNGNAGNQATIDALAGLMEAHPRSDHRFTLEHYAISTPDQTRRIKALGGVVSVNPYYLYARSEFNAPYIGADRAYTSARLKTLVDAGVPTSLHTDSPVAPPIPLEGVWIAVNRFGLSGKVRGPEERISVDQALRMITIDAAYTLGVEDKVGSIAAGKFADFTVLERDPSEVAPEKIRDIPVWGTVVGGKVFPAIAPDPRR